MEEKMILHFAHVKLFGNVNLNRSARSIGYYYSIILYVDSNFLNHIVTSRYGSRFSD